MAFYRVLFSKGSVIGGYTVRVLVVITVHVPHNYNTCTYRSYSIMSVCIGVINLTGQCNCTVGTPSSLVLTVPTFLGLNGLTINLLPLLLLLPSLLAVSLSAVVRDFLATGNV